MQLINCLTNPINKGDFAKFVLKRIERTNKFEEERAVID